MATDSERGWLVDVGGEWRFAVGGQRVVEYLFGPTLYTLPCTPVHCPGVIAWRGKLIPIVDLGLFMSDRPSLEAGRAHRAVVLAYQEQAGRPHSYGALVVRSAPVEVWASDDRVYPLPENPQVLRRLASSCFSLQDRAVPVLDVNRLFAEVLSPVAVDCGIESDLLTAQMSACASGDPERELQPDLAL